MIYLIIAIFCAAAINLGFALAKKNELDTLNITLVNYIAACAISFFMMQQKLGQGVIAQPVISDTTPKLAVFAGVFYILAFLVLQFSVIKSGPSLTTMFNRLSMVIPVLVSIIVFNEVAAPTRWIGICLAIVALVIFNYDGGVKLQPLLLGVFVCCGTAELCNNLFTKWCPESDKPFFLTIVFGTAGLITLLISVFRKNKKRFNMKEVLFGMCFGAVNLSSSFFMIKALSVLPSTIVFPSLAVGVILITALLGKAFFGEHLDKKARVALVLTIVSLVIINL